MFQGDVFPVPGFRFPGHSPRSQVTVPGFTGSAHTDLNPVYPVTCNLHPAPHPLSHFVFILPILTFDIESCINNQLLKLIKLNKLAGKGSGEKKGNGNENEE